jgi:hypothetical protein
MNLTISELVNTYIITRYNLDKFYSVVINTGASQKSTAGYNQSLAYRKTYPTVIDISKARQVKVQFGIGVTSSIRLIIVQTPIGNIEFQIIQADTPFLFYLVYIITIS